MAKQPSSKQSYRYDGPVTSFDVEVQKTRNLFPGRSYSDLPEEHPIIANLIERKLLVPETTAAEPVATEGA